MLIQNVKVAASEVVANQGYTLQEYIDNSNMLEVNVMDYIPANIRAVITDLNASQAMGSVRPYIEEALAAATAAPIAQGAVLKFPAGFFWLDTTLVLPRRTRIRGVYPETYFIALPTFSGTATVPGSIGAAIVSLDNSGQDPYEVSGFQINAPTGASNLVGLHIGGCRNSTFSNISVTGCYDAGIMIYPKNPDSGDVENFTMQHCWTLGGGFVIQNNPSISRGNITDGQATDCMFFAGLENQTYEVSNPAVRFTSRGGKQIYGVRLERCYTMTIRQSHVYLDNTDGIMRSNTFVDLGGESQLADGTLSPLIGEPLMFINGSVNSTYKDVYRSGMGDRGLVVSNSHDNTFDGLYFPELLHIGIDNTWLYLDSGCYNNTFENINYDRVFDVDYHSAPLSAMKYFRRKINDDGANVFRSPCITSNPVVAYGRDYLFSVTGTALTNFPQPSGITFVKQSSGACSAVFGTGSDTLTMSIPINNLQNSKQVFALLVHQFTSIASTAVVEMGFNGKFVTIAPQDAATPHYAAVSRMVSAGASTFQIRVSGADRTAQTIIDMTDLIISGNGMAYPYNFVKVQGVY